MPGEKLPKSEAYDSGARQCRLLARPSPDNRRRLLTMPCNVQEILVRRRQLETSYNFFAGVGLSYTFGSIFNNIVNPRFGSSGGGGGMMITF